MLNSQDTLTLKIYERYSRMNKLKINKVLTKRGKVFLRSVSIRPFTIHTYKAIDICH